jgi:hypothetical protein
MRASFTPEQKKLLQGQSGKLANKHNCSQTYVNLIIRGEREVNSELAKKVLQDLESLIILLTPDSPESQKNQQ